jgi:hypothetical protein
MKVAVPDTLLLLLAQMLVLILVSVELLFAPNNNSYNNAIDKIIFHYFEI